LFFFATTGYYVGLPVARYIISIQSFKHGLISLSVFYKAD